MQAAAVVRARVGTALLAIALLASPSFALAVDVLVPSTSLTMRGDGEPPFDLGRGKLRFKSSTRDAEPAGRIVVPAGGGADDPTDVGATLVVESTGGSGERVVYDLPRGSWSATGDSSDPSGYQYRSKSGAVQKVVLRNDSLRVSAGGESFRFTLDEVTQGSVAVRLEIGSAAWCANALARVGGDPPTSDGYDEPGRFTAGKDGPAPPGCPINASSYALTVTNGFGSGRYAPGSLVHVWADVDPASEIVTAWSGDDELLDYPREWHASFVMPARDVAVAAAIEAFPFTLASGTFFGVTARAKTYYHYLPPSPRGVVLVLHGSGGSAGYVLRVEPRALARRLAHAGYGIVGPEAEESVAGDLDGDGNVRWDMDLDAGNVDIANLNDLVGDLRAAGSIPPGTPLYVMGFSNGSATSGMLGAVAHSSLAASFPELVFQAVNGYCAPTTLAAVTTTLTPTGFFMCENDSHPSVDNDVAFAEYELLADRGVPTFYDAHPPSPLYPERFERVGGVSPQVSAAVASEIEDAGFVDADGYFLVTSNAIANATTVNPSLMPTFSSQAPAVRVRMLDQMGAMRADHQSYSDWATRTLDWFELWQP